MSDLVGNPKDRFSHNEAQLLCSTDFYRQRPTGGTALDDFEVLSTIGTGSYGTCKKIRRKKDGKVNQTLPCYSCDKICKMNSKEDTLC